MRCGVRSFRQWAGAPARSTVLTAGRADSTLRAGHQTSDKRLSVRRACTRVVPPGWRLDRLSSIREPLSRAALVVRAGLQDAGRGMVGVDSEPGPT